MTELSFGSIGGRVRGSLPLDPWAYLSAQIAAERERWALWVPVVLAIGIGIYFSLDFEPWPFLGTALAVPCLGASFAARRSASPLALYVIALLLPVGIAASGMALAQFETWRATAPVLDHPLGVVLVEGKIIDAEVLDSGTRVTIAPSRIGDLRTLPRLVRVKLRFATPDLAIGDRISLKASLMPPPGPALPGGFDFQRQAWFRGLGGVGYAVGHAAVAPADPGASGSRLRVLRATMTERIRAALSPETAGIAAALITGERGAVPANVNQDYRDSGLAHLLVIAGLHMTLVTGFVFFAVRGVLALIPALALRYPIKKWAAAAALLVALLYLMISGAAVPTQRAFVMVALGLAAILIDRLQVSMLGVAWAAGVVLVLDPSALTGVSFQMSFAAVVGLVSFYETFGPQLSAARTGAGPIGRASLHLGGIAITTIVATLGTAAFSIYHFNRFAVFSVIANVVAVPLAGLWVMPWAFATCLLMPLGLERFGLVPMSWGIEAIEAVAHWTATLPYAVVDLPSMPDWGLMLIAAGGLWLALWRLKWRCWGLAPMIVGAASLLAATPPDILASGDGKLVAIRTAGGYLLSSDKADRVEAEDWLRAAGGVTRGLLPEAGTGAGDVRCDALGCIWRTSEGLVAIDRDPAALLEDCRRAAIVVALVPARRACRATAIVVDHADLRKGGSTAIWLGAATRLETANGTRGTRPWVPVDRPWEASSAGTARPDDPGP